MCCAQRLWLSVIGYASAATPTIQPPLHFRAGPASELAYQWYLRNYTRPARVEELEDSGRSTKNIALDTVGRQFESYPSVPPVTFASVEPL